jgi:hypothetical protein
MNHEISLQAAVDLTSRFRDLRPSVLNPLYVGKDIVPNSETFDRAAIEALLGQADCQQVRIYYGMSPDLKIHAVLVGVDSNGRDILPDNSADAVIVENALRCPTDCPPASVLNP